MTGKALILLLMGILYVIPQASAQEVVRKGELDNFLGTLGAMNHVTPLEGAGSHGLNGLSLGFGNQQTSGRQSPLVSHNRNDDNTDPLALAKLHIVKGFSWPIDIGVNFGSGEGNRVHQWGGYLQWTVFEGLGLPAIAMRAYGSKLSGMRYAEINTAGAQLAISQAILGYVTVYGYLGRARHHARTTAPESDPLDPILFRLYGEDHRSYTRFWYDDVRAVGVRVMILPPFFSFSLESQETSGEARTVLAKVAVGV